MKAPNRIKTLKQQILLSILLNLHSISAIINRHPHNINNELHLNGNKGGSVYLNNKRPLWILEDQVKQRQYEESVSYTTRRPPDFYYMQNHLQHRQHNNILQLPARHQRPYQYAFRKRPHQQQQRQLRYQQQPSPQQYRFNNHTNHYIPLRRRNSADNYEFKSMPIFDSLPGDDIVDAPNMLPLFIYNGPKGELILNTMMSTHKYPMQEPVPGQVLYPPVAPMFQPKPIVERFRIPGQAEPVNLTLIPFYAHEAVNPRSYDNARLNTITTTTAAPPPTVLYAAPAAAPPTAPSATAVEPIKKRRQKKAKQYSVFHSPQEVHWSPSAPQLATMQLVTPTTPFPMTLASPLQNHRYYDISAPAALLTTPATPTTAFQAAGVPLMPSNFKLTYRDDEDHFQIVYVDESLEKPTTTLSTPTQIPAFANSATTPPLMSSHYALAKEYYAFPVFTLGKLLQPNSEKSMRYLTNYSNLLETQTNNHNVEAATAPTTEKENGDTWFILNSRYKGPHKHSDEYRHSSKYVQQSAAPDITTTTYTEENLFDNEYVS